MGIFLHCLCCGVEEEENQDKAGPAFINMEETRSQEQCQGCPVGFSIQETLILAKVVQRSFERGIISAKEAQVVGAVYDKLERVCLSGGDVGGSEKKEVLASPASKSSA